MDLIDIYDLHLKVDHFEETFHILRGINLSVPMNSSLGIVGESGSGKTMTCLSIMHLLPKGAKITKGEILFQGEDICHYSDRQMETIRGKKISMIFQDARAALNPVLTVGDQISDIYCYYTGNSRSVGMKKAVEVLGAVGIPNARSRVKSYPHELSGGMCQRTLIAMALVSTPKVIIADEITSGIDVTIQSQIIELVKSVSDELSAGIIFVSHDIGVIIEACSDIAIMYSGMVLEQGRTSIVLRKPLSLYTEELLKCFEIGHSNRMRFIPGTAPDLKLLKPGCPFAPRCKYAMDICRVKIPELRIYEPGHAVACHKYVQDTKRQG
ncbi:Oligopeptide transport ATP-binding protein OppD [subsurface metagenome]